MRVLMRKPRFRDRLKYLINTEWEVTQPNKLSLASMYEEIADDSEMSPQARLKAIDGLAKLAQADKEKSDSKAVSVVFNFSERPKGIERCDTAGKEDQLVIFFFFIVSCFRPAQKREHPSDWHDTHSVVAILYVVCICTTCTYL